MQNFIFSIAIFKLLNKIKNKYQIKNKYIDPNKIVNSIIIAKYLKIFFKNKNDFLTILAIYIRQLKPKKYNYITLLLILKYIDNKLVNKLSYKNKNFYYKILYILSISRILYRWSCKNRCKEIPHSLLIFLDNATGLDKNTIETLRNDMTEKGWFQKSTSNNLLPLLHNTIFKSIIYISKVIFYNELTKIILFKIITGKIIKFNFKNKILNIIFLTSVLQFPIFMVSLYNYYFQYKPNKYMITIWTLLSATPIFITNFNQTKIVSIFSQAILLNNYMELFKFKLPNLYIINFTLNNIVDKNLKQKLNTYINI